MSIFLVGTDLPGGPPTIDLNNFHVGKWINIFTAVK